MYLNLPKFPDLGLVQTFYANGASYGYLKQNYELKPSFAATGVKYLHKKAVQYGIGLYFEANGHGSVVFNGNYLHRCEAVIKNKTVLLSTPSIVALPGSVQKLNEFFSFLEFFVAACRMANPTVGDAVANMLLFEVALRYLKLPEDYAATLNLYKDMPSQTTTIKVKDKSVIKTNETEEYVVEPVGLQEEIEKIRNHHQGFKAFLRPSGTENLVRLHVEAAHNETVCKIVADINKLVQNHPSLQIN